MKFYFAGNTMASFSRTNVAIQESTVAGTFDANYVPNSMVSTIETNTDADYFQTYPFLGAATGTIWLHYDIKYPIFSSTANMLGMLFLNGSANVFKIQSNALSNAISFWYWNGSTWIQTGPSLAVADNQFSTIDLQIILGSGFNFYSGNVLVASGSGWTGGGSAVTAIQFYSFSAGYVTYWSQVILADSDTRDLKYGMRTMNGNSLVNTGGTGTWTDVSETPLSDANSESVSVSGNAMGQTYTNLPIPSGYYAMAVAMSARGRVSAPISDGKLGLLTHGINYPSAGKGYGPAYAPEGRIDTVNPNTGTTWTQAEINALETFIQAA